MNTDDVITQESVIGLLDMVEDHGVIYANELDAEFPVLWRYMVSTGWAVSMRNGVARATTTGAALRRFVSLEAS